MLRSLWLLLAWLLAAPACLAAGAVQVGIVHVNDVYQIDPIDPKGPRGGLARLATLVREIRRAEPGTLFLFGGDTLSPSLESGLYQGAQMIAAWNALGVDLAVPGNHEFDFGGAVFRTRLAESRFPWLAANLEADGPLPVRASALRTVNGVRVGIVGLLTPDTPRLSKPGPGFRFGELLPAARREAAELRRQGADLLVALTHCTLEEDRILAASGLFDLILGGHDHHLVTEIASRTPLFKAGSDARDALHLRLHFDASPAEGGRPVLVRTAWDVLPVDGRWAEDERVLPLARQYGRDVEQRLGETVGETAVPLDARGETVRRGESNLGNFAADAVRAALGADAALLNAGGFRLNRVLGPGPLSRRDLAGLLPFRNALVVLSASGEDLRRALEHGLALRARHGQTGAMPQVSGLRLAYDLQRPDGERIVALEVGGRPVEPGRRYTLATSSYLAGGGDGYGMLKDLPVLRPAEGSPIETDVLTQAVEKAGRISPAVDGRLKDLGHSPPAPLPGEGG